MNAIADVEAVRTILVEAARRGQAVTYSEVLNGLGHRFTRPRMRALCKTLEAIDGSRKPQEPELAVLVVRQSDGLPGQGWWIGHAAETGYDGPWERKAATSLVRDLQAAAFAYWNMQRITE